MFRWIQSLDASLRKINIRYLGIGLLIAWVYCTWCSGNQAIASETLIASLICSALGLIVLVMRPKKRTPISFTSAFGASVIMSITTLLFSFSDLMFVCLTAAAIGGLASSVLWIAWGELFCQIDQEAAESCIPASLLVFICAGGAVLLLPAAIGSVVSSSLPAISCILLLLGRCEQPADFSFPQPALPFRSILPALVKLAFCSMVCSVAAGFVMASLSPTNPISGSDNQLPFYLCGGAIAACISLVAISHTSKMNFSLLYEWVIPLIVFALSLCIAGEAEHRVIAAILTCTASLCTDVLFYAIFARITSQRFCLPSEAFGLFRAFAQVGFLIGGASGSTMASQQANLTHIYLLLICICVVILPLFLHLQKRFETPQPTMHASEKANATQQPDAITQITEEFKLSNRESEVLGYLARGRSVPYMREAMVLSKSTIETHIKHIYAKTEVHSKQELIDLIESRQH